MMSQETLNEWLAVGKHAVTYVAGILTALGITAVINPNELVTSFDHIINGIKEIALGAGPIAATAMALWAKFSTKLSTKVADVKAAEPKALIEAVQQVSPVTLRDAVAEQPGVVRVQVESKTMADASPSPKVTT